MQVESRARSVCLIGPSGSGKSTCVALNLLEEPNDTIMVGDTEV